MNATLSMEPDQRTFSPLPAILLVIVAAVAVFAVCNLHADVKHETAVTVGATCHQQPEMRFFNPVTRRYMDVCLIDGKYTIWVWQRTAEGTEQPITSFVKEKFTRLEQMLQYVRNAGYDVPVTLVKP